MRNRFKTHSLLVALLAGCPAHVLAQATTAPTATPPAQDANTDTGRLSEIVVTATRQATNVQNIPLSVSAISGDSLRNRGITDATQLSSLAPNLRIDTQGGDGQVHASVRGIASTELSTGASSPVAFYIDDVYQATEFGNASQIFDLGRVEVLRGPQGTLFGKNATGGAISYYSQAPTNRDEGYLNLDGGGGQFRHYQVEGAFNKPISDTFYMRASILADHRDAYVTNQLGGPKIGQYSDYNGRLQFRWAPSDKTDVNLKLFYTQRDGDGTVWVPVGPGAPPGADSTHVPNDVANNYENFKNYGATLKIDQSFGDFKLTSITAGQKGTYDTNYNGDSTAFAFDNLMITQKTWQVSQELRLATPVDKPLHALVGLYGMYDRLQTQLGQNVADFPDAFGHNVQISPSDQKSTSLAAFGSVTYEVTNFLSLIGGARYSHDQKKMTESITGYTVADPSNQDLTVDALQAQYGPGDAEPCFTDAEIVCHRNKKWSRVTWDATANLKPTSSSLIYAKVSTGYRSGGYPNGLYSAGSFSVVQPEKVTSYEGGFKSEWFDHKLRINGSVFYMQYRDMQVQIPSQQAFTTILGNAASAHIKGVELEVEAAPVRHLTISGSVGYNQAKYKKYVAADPNGSGNSITLSGNTLPFAPRWTGNITAAYEVPVGDVYTIDLNTDWNYRSRVFFDQYNVDLASDPSRVTGNARIGFGDKNKGWRISGYVKNLTNKNIRAYGFVFGDFAPSNYLPRRQWGLQAGFKF